ncbi:hypothetical protein Pan216_48080 [Planctomycetes bacterium Pan216]|uniref:Uncharacterized protein n=1 Tax=Kolteria novifilia TaxID=2527975 RepID=A0A518BAF9_9BACT|nr:hypothetical protein Pan216_48080 [Planctomycetes bacterium Pan216]
MTKLWRRSRQVLSLLLGLVALGAWGTTTARGQNRSSRQRQEGPTRLVRGTLVEVGSRGVVLKPSDGFGTTSVPADRNTELRVLGLPTEEMLVKGATAEVSGDVTPDYVIRDAQVMIDYGTRRRVRTSGGSYYMRKASRAEGTIPVVIVGTILGTDPLRIKANNSIRTRYYFAEDVGQDNVINRTYDFPSIGKTFAVELERDEKGKFENVYVDLGPNSQFSKPDDHVVARVDADTGIARSVTIYREEPVDLEALGLKKKSKSRRSRTRSTRPSKSKSTPKSEEESDAKDN